MDVSHITVKNAQSKKYENWKKKDFFAYGVQKFNNNHDMVKHMFIF